VANCTIGLLEKRIWRKGLSRITWSVKEPCPSVWRNCV
jgi:hypothetical protein